MKRALLILLLGIGNAQAASVPSIYHNNKAVEALKGKRVAEGQRDLLFSLKESPQNLVARLNLGVSFVQLGEWDKAIKEFAAVDQQLVDPSELKFIARFNIGRAYQEQKKVPEALKAYQAALEIKPASIETKANIELMTSQKSGGGGGGDQKDQQQDQQNKDQQGSGDKPNDQQKDQGQKENKEKTPQDLSKSDIEKIMEELKSQEQKIRALEYGTQAKERENDKAW